MKKLLSQIKVLRNEYAFGKLEEKNISKNPFDQFEKWLQLAVASKVGEPNAMTLATISKEGFPDARIVLLRDFGPQGFSFFTNYNSIKGREIRYSKKACLNFFWPELSRQVRIKGVIAKLSSRESDEYFASRPRESQIAAWASHQSETLVSRDELEVRFKMIDDKYTGKKVPRPPHWGGFLLKPVYIEFWQGRTNRLHDRLIYERSGKGSWKMKRLNP
jgi:pyridoxamine 5'-phosphate oxidase